MMIYYATMLVGTQDSLDVGRQALASRQADARVNLVPDAARAVTYGAPPEDSNKRLTIYSSLSPPSQGHLFLSLIHPTAIAVTYDSHLRDPWGHSRTTRLHDLNSLSQTTVRDDSHRLSSMAI